MVVRDYQISDQGLLFFKRVSGTEMNKAWSLPSTHFQHVGEHTHQTLPMRCANCKAQKLPQPGTSIGGVKEGFPEEG